jgi:hypothetical protein
MSASRLPKTTLVLASFMMLAGVLVMACAVNDEEPSAQLLGTVAERLVAR